MKRGFAVIGIIMILLLAVSCGEKEATEEPIYYDIAMVTSTANLEDGSFNQSIWEGIEAFVDEHPVSYKYYQSMDNTHEEYMRTIREAVEGGAEVIIAAGSDFGGVITAAQKEYKEISFVLIDGVPTQNGKKAALEDNTASVVFAEEQAGYLAGYAAVKEGYQTLGFIGGRPLPPVKRFEMGFLQGADAAAEEKQEKVTISVKYTGRFDASKDAKQLAANWYENGTEAIFACGGQQAKSIIAAAEAADAAVIGVDCDQSAVSDAVITSAVKEIDAAVTDMLERYYNNQFPKGKVLKYDLGNKGVGLSMENSRFKQFTQQEYEACYSDLASGKYAVEKEMKYAKLKYITIKQ